MRRDRVRYQACHRRRYSARYGLTDPSDLDVYFVGASGIHPSRLRTSSDSSFGWTGHRLWRTGKRFGWTGANPRRCFFFVGGGREQRVRAKRWPTGVASCVEEILDGGRGSTGTREATPRSCFCSQKKRYKRTVRPPKKIAQGRHEIQGRHRKERNFTSQ